ncbi:MAG: CPBP family intramembrane metalloprotease [Bacteroidota bacterium]|nr:CPBP family intramembrane metalloprotease [Bacteroidota bacterium]
MTSFTQKTLSIAGVILFSIVVVRYSAISVIGKFLPFTYSSNHFHLFEQHFWQFVFSFLAMIFLSRGHLWSYGINSQNLKVSMAYLAWLYLATVLLTIVFAISGKSLIPIFATDFPLHYKTSIILMLIYWMSAPVANTILFFGFGQTVLMKQWGDSLKLFGIPWIVILSAFLFTVLSTAACFDGVGIYSWAITFFFGVYAGFVYWKTNSLITPMLAHAFFFGFPLFVKIAGTI